MMIECLDTPRKCSRPFGAGSADAPGGRHAKRQAVQAQEAYTGDLKAGLAVVSWWLRGALGDPRSRLKYQVDELVDW